MSFLKWIDDKLKGPEPIVLGVLEKAHYTESFGPSSINFTSYRCWAINGKQVVYCDLPLAVWVNVKRGEGLKAQWWAA